MKLFQLFKAEIRGKPKPNLKGTSHRVICCDLFALTVQSMASSPSPPAPSVPSSRWRFGKPPPVAAAAMTPGFPSRSSCRPWSGGIAHAERPGTGTQ